MPTPLPTMLWTQIQKSWAQGRLSADSELWGQWKEERKPRPGKDLRPEHGGGVCRLGGGRWGPGSMPAWRQGDPCRVQEAAALRSGCSGLRPFWDRPEVVPSNFPAWVHLKSLNPASQASHQPPEWSS